MDKGTLLDEAQRRDQEYRDLEEKEREARRKLWNRRRFRGSQLCLTLAGVVLMSTVWEVLVYMVRSLCGLILETSWQPWAIVALLILATWLLGTTDEGKAFFQKLKGLEGDDHAAW